MNLKVVGDRLEVTVRDAGCGFDLKGLHENKGSGIRSMQERGTVVGRKVRNSFGIWKGDDP